MSENKHKSKHRRKQKFHTRNFSTPMLAVAICTVLLLEGAMFGVVGGDTIRDASSIFDISSKVSQTRLDLNRFIDPFAMTIKSVETFYKLAAIETDALLRNNIIEHSAKLITDIDKFYMLSSYEMGNVFDLTI